LRRAPPRVDSLPNVAPRKRKNPWTSVSEVILWLLFVVLLIPVGFAGYAVGHYTSIGKPPTTVTVTVAGPGRTNTTPTTGSTTTASTTTTSSSGGAIAAGKVVYDSQGCGGCHTFKPAGSTGTTGPNLDTAPATDAQAAGMPLPAFIKQSIIDPNAYVPKGYPSGVMPASFGTTLTSTQINNLVAFILSGTQR
jgi:mono/diheme cytochrome c family protein